MLKRLTVNNVSFYISLLILGITLIFYFIFSSSEISLWPWWQLLVLVLAYIICLFFVIRYFLLYIVFSRLKLIYKVINEASYQKQKNNLHLITANTNLNFVNKEVLEWAAQRKNELEDLKKLEKYRKNFVGNISHELKTPLFSIQGYLHTLLDGGLEDKKINIKYIEKALSNAERLQAIVDDLEVINSLEEDSKLDLSEFNLRRLSEEVITDLELLSKEKHVKISIHKSPEQGLWVEADKQKIRQVIENLLTNSIKYGHEDGKTKITFTDQGEYLRMEIADNGIGIEDKHIKHLFDRFYRVDKSRARDYGGSGLGLAIVKHILEAHSSKIEVKSELGKGTSFAFALPKMKYTVLSDEAQSV